MVKEFPVDQFGVRFSEAGGNVLFTGGLSTDSQIYGNLFATDGTPAGTRLLAEKVYPSELVRYRDKTYFVQGTGTIITTLIETDGTTQGTRPADIPGWTYGAGLTPYNDRLYFTVRDAQNHAVIYRTDGTAAGTELVFAPTGTLSVRSGPMIEANDMLLFTVDDTSGPSGTSHWYATNGTPAGTSEITGTYRAGYDAVQVGSRVLFPAEAPGKGTEWFRTTLPDAARPQATSGRLVTLPAGGQPVRLTFTENVAPSLAPSDLVLTDLATGNAVPSAFSAVAFDPATDTGTFTVSPTRFPGGKLPPGRYRAALAAGAVADASGNTSAAAFQFDFTVSPPATVVGRYAFYNGSSLDAGNAGADARDDAAIAADKQALRAGGTATFANVTNYTRGVNGIMVDLANLPAGTSLGGEDFSFRAIGAASTVPLPYAVTVRRAAGANGSDRVTLVWVEGTRNAWLEVTVKANARTGLSAPDVFTFGNLVGDTGGAAAFKVDAGDVLRTRLNVGRTDAPSLDRYDFNRDGVINFQDLLTVRTAQRRGIVLAATAAAPAAAPGPPATPTRAERPSRRSLFGDESALLAGVD
jgi:hypothetical protein